MKNLARKWQKRKRALPPPLRVCVPANIFFPESKLIIVLNHIQFEKIKYLGTDWSIMCLLAKFPCPCAMQKYEILAMFKTRKMQVYSTTCKLALSESFDHL